MTIKKNGTKWIIGSLLGILGSMLLLIGGLFIRHVIDATEHARQGQKIEALQTAVNKMEGKLETLPPDAIIENSLKIRELERRIEKMCKERT